MARNLSLLIAMTSLLASVSSGCSISRLARVPRAGDESPVRDHVYRIRNKASGTYVDLEGGSTGRRTSILGRQRAPANINQLDQFWKLELSQIDGGTGNIQWNFRNVRGGTYMDLDNGNTRGYAYGYERASNGNQNWYIVPDGDAFRSVLPRSDTILFRRSIC